MSAQEALDNPSGDVAESGGFQYAYEQIIAEEKDRAEDEPQGHYQADIAQMGGNDEDDDEDPQGFLDPSHPLMERVQRALSQQLQKENERLTLQIRDKDEAVSRIKRHRETVGVELYSMQQQLAKLQIGLERAHEKCSNAVQVRMQSEADLQEISGLYDQKQQQRVDIMKRREEAQLELDKFNATLRQIELYNLELKSDILVTRRAAYGTEEQLQSKEKEKRMQDFHIERLNEQLKTVTEDLELYTQQLDAQREATKAAQAMLKQAMVEMEDINAEKKEYLQKWRASLTGMARRDAALQAAEAAVEQQKEKIRSLEMEVTGLKSSAKKEQETNEKLTAILQRVEAETQFLQSQLAAVAEQRKVLNEQYLMLRSALEQSDRDLTTVKNEQRQLQTTVDQLSKRKEAAVRRKQELEEKIIENMGDQTTLEKSAQNVVKATQKLQQQVREKEVSIGEVRNELARIQVDSLNTEAHSKELKQTVEEFEKELSEKDTLIEKYEQEIRQRHDQIEKKQIYILRLNKKYDTLTAHKEEVNTGPLEATINHLTKEISSKEKDCSELQRQWIRAQTELVGLMSEIAQREDTVAELKARTTVMDQKKARIESQFRQAKADIKELEAGVRSMHNGFGKVNELIAKNVALQEDLSKTTYNMETEFVEKLKELEQLSTQNQQRIEGLRVEKDRLYEDIIEAERQIMLWEKKIQLERETQAALDPEVGQNEIKAMKKEIHRMELRLGQLKREQERMVQEMELVISKQETIKSSYGANKSQEREHLSQATLKKRINDLKSSIKQSLSEAKRADFDMMRHEEEGKYLQQQLEQIQQQYGVVEDKKLELSRRTQQALFEKRLNLERTLLAQKRAQRYADFTSGKYKIAESLDEVTSKLTKQRRKTQKIKAVLSRLADENPKYAEWFTKLSTFA